MYASVYVCQQHAVMSCSPLLVVQETLSKPTLNVNDCMLMFMRGLAAPVLTCPSNITIEPAKSSTRMIINDAAVNAAVNATDNSGYTPTTAICTLPSGIVYNPHQYTHAQHHQMQLDRCSRQHRLLYVSDPASRLHKASHSVSAESICNTHTWYLHGAR